ncbi:hypothetical protein CCAX7_25680 [Capsulimonas corticalis]|uniref:Uncharacterized protein n=1 Tax=Capsulimonas corticalis TaxID=2219043 RepID=A0A402CVS8_9BACT|nr:hypothetical protein [Capsulimonas corticalis]BDI30517.1 hypothetical protein CCAX7_25680 [Capsulimonas corticalis]
MQGVLIYQCRLCGGQVLVDVDDIQGAMLLVRVSHEQDTTDIVIPHRCDNGDYGVADLKGGRATE